MLVEVKEFHLNFHGKNLYLISEKGFTYKMSHKEKSCVEMSRKKAGILAVAVLAVAFLLGGCGVGKESEAGKEGGAGTVASESWAYVHEDTTEILRLYEDGRAIYKGNAYSFEKSDDFLNLHGEKGEELKLRYAVKNDGMLLYEATTYHYVSGPSSEGLVGLWKGGEEDRLSYEFTDKGTYLEDGVFPGHYTLDEGAGTIKLMYNDHFEDIYLYYTLSDGELTIEYPWPLVHTVQTAAE